MSKLSYDDVVEGKSGMFPLSDRALFTATGPDRIRYLNGQLTQDLTRLVPGFALYSGVLTGKGRLVSDLFISAGSEELWIDVPLSQRAFVEERLRKFLIADDVELHDVTDTFTLVHFFGKRPSEAHCSFNPRFGVAGFDVWSASETVPPPSASEVDASVPETLRIESGWGRWGTELDESTLPQEAHLEDRGLSYEKGCYVGQETVARIRSIGHVNRQLVSLELVEGDPVPPLLPLGLRDGSTEVGKVSSATFSPLTGRVLGLGMVGRKFTQPGQVLVASNGTWKVIPAPRKAPSVPHP